MEKQPAAAVSVPVTPEVEAPPVEAPPAAGASPESGYKVCSYTEDDVVLRRRDMLEGNSERFIP